MGEKPGDRPTDRTSVTGVSPARPKPPGASRTRSWAVVAGTLVLWTVAGVSVASVVASAPSIQDRANAGVAGGVAQTVRADVLAVPDTAVPVALVALVMIGVVIVASLLWRSKHNDDTGKPSTLTGGGGAATGKNAASAAGTGLEHSRAEAVDDQHGATAGVAGATANKRPDPAESCATETTTDAGVATPVMVGGSVGSDAKSDTGDDSMRGLSKAERLAEEARVAEEKRQATETARQAQEQLNIEFAAAAVQLRSDDADEQAAGLTAMGALAKAHRPDEPAEAGDRTTTQRCLAALCEFVRGMDVPAENVVGGGEIPSEEAFEAAKQHPDGVPRSQELLNIRNTQQRVLGMIMGALPHRSDLAAADASSENDLGVVAPAYVVDLSGANLNRLDLTDDAWASRAGAARIQLQGAEARAVSLTGANLNGSDMSGADMDYSTLRGCRLRGANLAEACIGWADLRGVDGTGAVFAHADVGESSFADAELAGANFEGAYLANARMGGANLSGASLAEARCEHANVVRADLTGANLCDADLTGVDMSDAQLSEAVFSGAQLAGANARRANCEGADFTAAGLERVDLREAVLKAATLRGAHLEGADLRGTDLRAANLDGASIAVVLPGRETVTLGEVLGEKPWQLLGSEWAHNGASRTVVVHDVVQNKIEEWAQANSIPEEDTARLIRIVPKKCFPAGGPSATPDMLLAKATAVTFGDGGYHLGNTIAKTGAFERVHHRCWLVENECVDVTGITWVN